MSDDPFKVKYVSGPIRTKEDWQTAFDRVFDFLLASGTSVRKGIQDERIVPKGSLLDHIRGFWDDSVLDDYLRGILVAYFCLLTQSHSLARQAVDDLREMQKYQANQPANAGNGESIDEDPVVLPLDKSKLH